MIPSEYVHVTLNIVFWKLYLYQKLSRKKEHDVHVMTQPDYENN